MNVTENGCFAIIHLSRRQDGALTTEIVTKDGHVNGENVILKVILLAQFKKLPLSVVADLFVIISSVLCTHPNAGETLTAKEQVKNNFTPIIKDY